MAEPYISQLKRERDEALDALAAAQDWLDAEEKIQNSAYKFDARQDALAKYKAYAAKYNAVKHLMKKEAK